MREIVFDTETTGLDCTRGDRLIEIGCVELLNHIPTGRTFHSYLNPRRAVSFEALQVHGLSDDFLRTHPCFEDVAEAFCEFIGDARLVAHNASFDRGFINMEFGLCKRPILEEHRFVDTLLLARRRHPNAQNSLDALCARYGISTSRRTLHGALLDAEILAEVYLELLGGRQTSLSLATTARIVTVVQERLSVGPRPRPLPARLTDSDRVAHRDYVSDLGGESLWSRYWPMEGTAAGDSAAPRI